MADERKRPAKTETLTIRLDPKTRFILDFLARVHGQTITTVIERSVMKAADQVELQEEFGANKFWTDFWDVSEAIRSLNVAQEQRLYPTFEEERRVAFAKEHWPFFFTSVSFRTYRRYSTDVLWPRIDEFIQLHEKTRAKDYFGAGRAMAEALGEAGLKPPEWPPKPDKPPVPDRAPGLEELDDEIPF